MIEMTKTPAFHDSKKIFGRSVNTKMVNFQKTEDCEKFYLLKLQHGLTSKLIDVCQKTAKLFMADLLPNGLLEKIIIC